MKKHAVLGALSLVAISCSSSAESAGNADAAADTVSQGDAAGEADVLVADAPDSPDSPGSGCAGRPEATCTSVDSKGCAWVVGLRVDPSRACVDPTVRVELCIAFTIAPAVVSCRIKVSTGEMFKFADAKAPPDPEYPDWRECTVAEHEVFSTAPVCSSLDAGADGG